MICVFCWKELWGLKALKVILFDLILNGSNKYNSK